MADNDGKDLERLVRFIEQSITPGSTVEHNVNLPVIGSSGNHYRQCDVVIRTGPKVRETVTIVEVQDRVDKTEIGELGDWLYKLEQVGAQHLICVSRHEFPTSIKEEAVRHGNTVRLITLKEIPAESLPINVVFTNTKFDLKEFTPRCGVSEEEVEKLGIKEAIEANFIGHHRMDVNEKCWSLDKNKLISLCDLCREVVSPDENSEGDGQLAFSKKNGPELYMHIENHFIRVSLECDFSWTYEVTEQPVTALSYEQNEDGILAWAAEIYTDDGYVKFPIVEDEGNYRIDGLLVKAPAGTTITLKVLKDDDGQSPTR